MVFQDLLWTLCHKLSAGVRVITGVEKMQKPIALWKGRNICLPQERASSPAQRKRCSSWSDLANPQALCHEIAGREMEAKDEQDLNQE